MNQSLETIYSAAIRAVDPSAAVKKYLRRKNNTLIVLTEHGEMEYNLEDFNAMYVVGAGKGTSPMAAAIEDICGDYITEGIISVKYGYTTPLKKISVREASHPIPDREGQQNALTIAALLEKATENDLIISLISGGGSALLPLPVDEISLEQKGETTDLLLRSGASIDEINSVRKHLSQVKGGRLAQKASPAVVINLMISDVAGDTMDVIASGPFVPDNSTFSDALHTLKKYDIFDRVPESVKNHLIQGSQGMGDETPDSNSPVFKNITNLIVSSNIIACSAAAEAAKNLGYNTMILSSVLQGDTTVSAEFHLAIAREILNTANPLQTPACIISGGETTVKVRGRGLGGRNMEFALQCVKEIAETSIVAASVGTDGTDGPTDAAGAMADGTSLSRAEKAGIDIEEYITENDSYHFFEKLGDLIKTGPTNTNVMDIRIILVA